MKKIMIVTAALAMAISAQAGRITWGSGVLQTAGKDGVFSGTAVAAEAVTGYLFILTSDDYSAFKSTYDSDGYTKMAEAVYSAKKDSLASAISAKSDGDGKVSMYDSTLNKSSGYQYAAVVYTMTQGGKDYYIADIGKMAYASSGQTAQSMGTIQLGSNTKDKTTTAITGWQTVAVPEPTSGMLLLLGVAGLALRRRRA